MAIKKSGGRHFQGRQAFSILGGEQSFFLIEKNPGMSGKNQKVEQMMILNSRGDMVNGDCNLNHGSESLQGRHRSPWQAGGKHWLQNVRHTSGQGILD
jgi:hypothetical protein